MKKTSDKIFVISLGCPKNLVDTEKLLASRFKDFTLTDNELEASVILVNTCSFIVPAKEESLDTIFEYAHLKEKYPDKKLIVTGCLWEQYQDQIIEQIPEAEFLSNKNLNQLTERFLTTNGYAYLKIAEGCNRRCSFCTIPSFKGNYVSRSVKDILTEARLLDNKVKEILLISQDTSFYGTDLNPRASLRELVSELSRMNFDWIRTMYFYPTGITDEFIALFREFPKLCRYVDIPLQHLSAKILKAMKRAGDYQSYARMLENLRKAVPEIALRTTFIIGYPGETEEDFNTLCKGIEEFRFDRAGFFLYSDEEGTASHAQSDKVPHEVAEERLARITFLQEEISEEKLQSRVGRTYPVLLERYDENTGQYTGRSSQEAPEIDGLIYVHSKKKLNLYELVPVKITRSDTHNLFGVAEK